MSKLSTRLELGTRVAFNNSGHHELDLNSCDIKALTLADFESREAGLKDITSLKLDAFNCAGLTQGILLYLAPKLIEIAFEGPEVDSATLEALVKVSDDRGKKNMAKFLRSRIEAARQRELKQLGSEGGSFDRS